MDFIDSFGKSFRNVGLLDFANLPKSRQKMVKETMVIYKDVCADFQENKITENTFIQRIRALSGIPANEAKALAKHLKSSNLELLR